MSDDKVKQKVWPDWSNFDKTGVVQEEHPLSQPLPPGLKKGADIFKHLKDSPPARQPTDQEMFGSLVKKEAEIKALKAAVEKEWNERAIKAEMDLKKAKVEEHFSSPVDDEKWGNGTSYNSLLKKKLSKEEMEKRNMFVDGKE